MEEPTGEKSRGERTTRNVVGDGGVHKRLRKKGEREGSMSVGTAKAGRRVGMRGKRNQKIIQNYS